MYSHIYANVLMYVLLSTGYIATYVLLCSMAGLMIRNLECKDKSPDKYVIARNNM